MHDLIDIVLHVDKHLADFVAAYGAWVYGLLFVIILSETGYVETPFLPGDSLLFAAGAICALPGSGMNVWLTLVLLATAAFTGNAVNYSIGRIVGPRAFAMRTRLLNREHLDRAHGFFEKYGGKAIVLGRFVPIVRTFVPFVAGVALMTRTSFVFYNFIGAAAWVALCILAGYFFGNIPIVRNNFSLVTIGIVFVSILPIVFEVVAKRRRV